MTNRYEEASDAARKLLENFDEIDLAEMLASSNASAEAHKVRSTELEQEVTDTADAAAHLTTLMGKRAKQAEADRDRVQQAACRTAENLRHAVARAEQAEAAVERVRELHQRWDADPGSCAHCENGYGTSLPYPCPTVQALDQPQQPTTTKAGE